MTKRGMIGEKACLSQLCGKLSIEFIFARLRADYAAHGYLSGGCKSGPGDGVFPSAPGGDDASEWEFAAAFACRRKIGDFYEGMLAIRGKAVPIFYLESDAAFEPLFHFADEHCLGDMTICMWLSMKRPGKNCGISAGNISPVKAWIVLMI